MTLTTLAFGMPGPLECTIIFAVGLLIFGKRLPEVGKSVGRSIVEFKKGLAGIDDEVDEAVNKQKQKLEAKAADTTTVETGATTEAPANAEPSA